MNPLDYSKLINLWLTSSSTDYQELVVKLRDSIEKELKAKHGITRFKKPEHEKVLFHILADLFVTYKSDPKRYLAFSRDKLWYSKDTRYQPKRFALKPFINVITALDSLGYIETSKGFRDPKGTSRLSRMIATSKLVKLCDDHKLAEVNFYQLPNKETIILKSPKDDQGKKDLLDYEDTACTISMRDNLKLINQNIGKHWIDIKITDEQFRELQEKIYIRATSTKTNYNRKSPVDFTRTNLVRIFNNDSFEDGGRFYRGWWQEILSDYRKYITIDGQDTVEIDYSAMHFYIMYAEQGLSIPTGDPYTFDGYNRKDIKIALNIAINAESEKAGVIAIKNGIWPEKSYADVKAILELIIERHNPIASYFFSGKGVRLQYLDSKVAEIVMLNLLNVNQIVALPVHDSFIVIKEHKPYLLHQMKKCFKEIVEVDAKVKASDDIDYDKIIRSLHNIDWSNTKKITTSAPAITSESIEAGLGKLVNLFEPLTGYERRKEKRD
jgi:hypothetical protein